MPQVGRKALLKELFDTYELEPLVLDREHVEEMDRNCSSTRRS
jgi:hypothetical protein